MKKPLLIAILCCALPLVIIGFIYFYGGGFTDHSSMQQQPGSQKTDASVGNIFPDFGVIDIDGASLSNKSLEGKPSIIWFTTTWCTPCQVGAQKVAQINKELGKPINILVFFVDSRELENDLRNWRTKYADADWKLAFNNGIAEKIGIQFLDSKYLLGKEGVIRDFNTQIVNDQYLALLRSIAKENQ